MVQHRSFAGLSRLAALVIVATLAMAQGASAFCVYNEGKGPITAYQLPISARSFKKVVPPGGKECCGWKDCGGLSPERNVGLVTANSVLSSINGGMTKALSFIPGMTAIGVVNGAAWDEFNRQFGCAASVQTFNGGVAGLKPGVGFWGGWNNPGTKPPPGTADC
ncbi:hypothetical protein QJQ45_018362 [Haematococcus lacustris]|nr:hypothetical protein QJQ45_018362 [Haematococcus lacustris]